MTIEPQCPFGDIHICVCGIRYVRIDEEPADPHPKDLPGLLYRGECEYCVKASAGVR